MKIPPNTAEIFELLSKGQFLCSNSTNTLHRRLYAAVEEHYDELREYFESINFLLERGNEYFYFSRKETKVELERKIEIAFKWIDIVDFLKVYDNAFGPGYRFSPSLIMVKLNVDAVLKTKLESLKRYSKEDNYHASIKKIIEMLAKEGFAELESEISESYKVLTSFLYLEQLILSINIPEDVRNEIPE